MGLSMTRRLLLVVPALLLAVNAPGADERPRRRNRTEHDALAGAQRAGRRPEPGDLQKSGRDMQVDERLGVPTFLWAGKPGTATPWDGRGKQGPAAAARRHLGVYGKLWDLKPEDVAAAKVSEVHDEGGGAVITKFKQEVGGGGRCRRGALRAAGSQTWPRAGSTCRAAACQSGPRLA